MKRDTRKQNETLLTPLFRRRLNQAVDDAREARPSCSLSFDTFLDEAEGFVEIRFKCATHGAMWREFVAQFDGSPCPGQASPNLSAPAARKGEPDVPQESLFAPGKLPQNQ